ncbi:MAG TPA: hypothetical protein VKB05_21425 [Pyrinomonadaceae bacterium]|nr:hypothetical protein [Pyrinomonadaceae bacterium]
MIFTRPYETRHLFDFEEGDSHRHDLSIAIRAVDQFTEERPLTHLRAKLKELPTARPIRSISGWLCFEDIVPGKYKLLVQNEPEVVDPFFVKPPQGTWTDTLEIPVEVFPNVVLSFDLQLAPRPSYPFPSHATLVRGTVTRSSTGVADAVVRATYREVDPADNTQTVIKTVEALTNREGEYVAFFKRLPKVREGDPDLTADLVAVKGASQSQLKTVVVKEGTTQKVNALDLPL